MYQGIFPEGKIATCILVFDQSEALTPLQGNMRCLGRYKGVILLLGTSPLTSHFISLFSRHRSLYLISYSRVCLPQTSQTPFIFIWKTHLVLVGCRRIGDESRGFRVERTEQTFSVACQCPPATVCMLPCLELNFVFPLLTSVSVTIHTFSIIRNIP